jgi:hypothetical protein
MTKNKLKIAVCFFGHLRTFKQCAPNLRKNLLQRYDCDLFMHTWSKTNHNTATWHKNRLAQNDTKKEDILAAYGNFKAMDIEEQHPQDYGCAHFAVTSTSTPTTISIYGMGAMFYAMSRVNKLREDYEKKHNIKYDFVVFLRPDVLLKTKFDIGALLSGQYESDIDNAFVTIGNPFTPVSRGFQSFGAVDTFFFGRPSVISKVIGNLPDVRKLFKPGENYRNGPEYELIRHAENMGCIPYLMNLKYGRDVEILRLSNTGKFVHKFIKFNLFKHGKFILWLCPEFFHNVFNVRISVFGFTFDFAIGEPKQTEQ